MLGAPSFVDDGGEFSDSAGFFAEDLGGSGGDDDDFAGFGFSDYDAGMGGVLKKISYKKRAFTCPKICFYKTPKTSSHLQTIPF